MEQFRLMVFEAVWTTGSYTKAARQLGITQPAVSQNIAELEKELGTALFTRVGSVPATADATSGEEESVAGQVRVGKMTPTPAAEVFMRLAQKVLKGYDDIRTLFNPATAEYGTVRILADRSATEYALPKVLKVLHAAHPAVSFEVLPSTHESDDADVVISTVAVEQYDGVSLHFEVFGSATPFVDMVRMVLFGEHIVDFIDGVAGIKIR